MAEPALPAWDLVVATVDRTDALDRLLDSLDRQTHRAFRVLVVDQNEDDRVLPVLARHEALELVRLRSPRGLSRARNAALPRLAADAVAFPDDDCVYGPELLESVSQRLAAEPSLDGITGREIDPQGRSAYGWAREAGPVTRENVWHRTISFAIFLRRTLVERVGPFDERLGLGPDSTWSSGEEVDYVIRALRLGARVEYDPRLTVEHDVKSYSGADLRAVARRDGGSVGFLLGKHGYRRAMVARMLVRPVGGAVVSLARRDPAWARFHLETLRGRVAGYAAGRRASTSDVNSSR